MKRRIVTFLCTALLPILAAASPADACSPVMGYRIPTNYELVSRAELIVVGTVVTEIPFQRDKLERTPMLRVHPTVTLKGVPQKNPIFVEGVIGGSGYWNTIGPVYTRLDEAHPSVWMGGCSRQIYTQHVPVVLMFYKERGRWRQYAPAFSRAAEDVSNMSQAPWVRAVELYARIGSLPQQERRPALLAVQQQLRSSSMPADRQIADDIDYALDPNRPPK